MYKYPLSSKQKTIVSEWLSNKDKPLFILGEEGTGKSILGNQLLNDTHIVSINSEHIKYSGNIIDHIKDSLFKKDIMMMMCSKNQYKSLFIDDFHYFLKYDKLNAGKLIDFIKSIQHTYLVIISCNITDHKLVKQIESYQITLQFSLSFYKQISKTNQIKDNHSNYHTIHGLPSDKDTNYTLNQTLHKLFESNDINDIFLLSSSEYKTISYNLLQNSIYLSQTYDYLCDMYQSICMGDYIDTKYIDKDIPLDILTFFYCVYPRYICYKYLSIPKQYQFKYNNYVSKSLIQIHNQSLLSSYNYLELLNLIYQNKLIDKTNEIQQMIHKGVNMSILNKQIKVYNYYYNKRLKKKDIDKLKSIYVYNEKNYAP